MATKLEQISIPDMEYAGLYYPQIFANLRRINRINVPEITNEDSRELFIQLEKAFSLMAHYNNVLLDVVANEIFLPTLKLPESAKLLLALLNYNMLPASAAEVDILAQLVTTYNSAVTLLPAKRRVATKRSPEIPEITFENLEDVATSKRTDQINHALIMDQIGTGTCYTYSVQPDIIYYSAGTTFTTLNQYIRIIDSDLGNNTEDLQIIELLDETAPGSGVYNQVRVDGGGFVSESGLSYVLSNGITEDGGGNLLSAQLAAGTCATAVTISLNNKFYFGMADILFDRYDITLSTPASGVEGRIEFYDPDENYVNPDSVTVVGGTQLKMEITSLLGSSNATGSLVKVLYLPTGAETNVYSTLDVTTNIVTTSTLLGQASPSTTVTDYYVFADWRPVDVLEDDTDNVYIWEVGGGAKKMTYTLPQGQNDNWQKYSLYDASNSETLEGYYLRYRVVGIPGPTTAPIASTITFANASKYVVYNATQGKSVEDDPLGSSDGTADQEFTLTQTPYIYNSLDLYVDEGGGDIFWTPVNSLLSSKSYDRHYVLDLQSDGSAIVKFGDGSNGKIPPLGVNNIRGTYRIGCDQDGNVGVGTISNNIDSNGVFRSITNPRSAQYWIEADWNSQEALEKVKEEAPATITTMYRAVSATDCEILARNFRTLDNVRPVARAKAYEEALGPKTVELVVVGFGGSALSTANKDELEEYFNGGDTYNGVLVVNHELSATNYIPRSIGIQCTVTAYPVVTTARVYETLSALISPTALEIDRVTWTWRFGEEVPLSRIIAEIFNISPGNVFKVEITSPTTDVLLAPRELPIFDLASSNVVIEAP